MRSALFSLGGAQVAVTALILSAAAMAFGLAIDDATTLAKLFAGGAAVNAIPATAGSETAERVR
jgi:hypothetical protein